MIADAAQADAFAAGQREAAEGRRVALVRALQMDPATPWADALAAADRLAVLGPDTEVRVTCEARELSATMLRPIVDMWRAEVAKTHEANRAALVAALHLPPETTWADALARVVPVASAAKGCRGCARNGTRCWDVAGVRAWIGDYLRPDESIEPGAPECPGRVQKEEG